MLKKTLDLDVVSLMIMKKTLSLNVITLAMLKKTLDQSVVVRNNKQEMCKIF